MASHPVTAEGDSYYVTTTDAVIAFENLRDHSDGMAAEVTITLTGSGFQHWGKVSLASAISRSSFIKALSRAADAPLLAEDFSTACFAVVKKARQGQPPKALQSDPAKPDQWLIPRLLPRGETTILFGDGASGKSLCALGLAVAGLSGHPLGGSERFRMASIRAVLYLDWESQYDDHAARLWGLTRLHGTGEDITGIFHRPMDRPALEMISSIRKDVAQLHVDLVVVDSLGPASGSEPDGSDAAIRTLNALRSLGAPTRLVVAHVSKAMADSDKGARPYGSVFNANLARSTIEAKRDADEEEGQMVVTYSHRKSNRGGLVRPFALRYAFGDDGEIHVTTGEPDLKGAGLPLRIIEELRRGAASVTTLAETLDSSVPVIRTTLNRLAGRNSVVRLQTSDVSDSKKTLWGLAVRQRNNGDRNT